MSIRFQAYMRFTPASGMGQWCVDQMAVRMGMAFHLRENSPAAEMSYATVDAEGTFRCDAMWPNNRQDLADDTQAQFATLGPWLRPDTEDTSWMQTHVCAHDVEPPQSCPLPYWKWTL
jgi:hypothetical protein